MANMNAGPFLDAVDLCLDVAVEKSLLLFDFGDSEGTSK